MLKKIIKISFFLCLIFGSFTFGFAQTKEECSGVEECKALLEEYEKKIQEYEHNIALNKNEQASLNNKIYLLRQKISQIDYEIKKSKIIISDLEVQLGDTENSIKNTSKEIEDSRQRLADVLQTIYQEDQKSSLEILIGNEEISDFFEDVFALEKLLGKSYDILNELKNLQVNLEEQKISLKEKQDEWQNMKEMQILQKEESQRTRSEKEWLLSQTKGEEKIYQELLAENRKKAQAIRERLFSLIGVPDAPTFGEALGIARYVEGITGVRAPLLLAVLRQESDIGKNVGQCYLKNTETGSGIIASTGQPLDRVMKPSRDIGPFLIICEETGQNPKNTLVSCPMSFGWGGAMGPAQFIPSTWIYYKDRVANITGKPANPWNIRDAFLAAGLLLRDAGAGAQTYNAEWRAAMVYFSGSTNPAYSFYGNSVMSLTKEYENDIAQLDKFGYNK